MIHKLSVHVPPKKWQFPPDFHVVASSKVPLPGDLTPPTVACWWAPSLLSNTPGFHIKMPGIYSSSSPQADGFCLTGFDWGIKWKKSKQKQMGVSKNGGYQLAQNILLFNLMFETSWYLEYPILVKDVVEDLEQKRLGPLEMSQKFSRFGDSIDLEFNHPPKILLCKASHGRVPGVGWFHDDFLRRYGMPFAKDIRKKYNSRIFCGQNHALSSPICWKEEATDSLYQTKENRHMRQKHIENMNIIWM